MYASSLHGNREVPGTTDHNPWSVRLRKARYRNLNVNVTGKSDGGVLSMKRANKGAQPNRTGQPSAELVEKRPPAKGNTGQTPVTDTQGSEAALSDLSKVREAAKRDTKLQFNNLLHHVSIDLLRQSYLSLNRWVATGVDGVTWQEYREGLEDRLHSLHDRVQSEQYQPKPSKRTWIPKSNGEQRPIRYSSARRQDRPAGVDDDSPADI